MASKLIQTIAGRNILVTGASSGLGEATARYLALQGAKVTVVDLNVEQGEKIAREIKGCFAQADVCSETEVQSAIDKSVEFANSPLFAAVSCAGLCPGARVLGKRGPHKLSLFSKVIEVNLIGTFNVNRLAAAAMSASGANDPKQRNISSSQNDPLSIEEDPALNEYVDNGVLINTASIAAYEGQIGQAAYSASKGGIVGLTLPLARELAEHKIRVCAICPGIMNTSLIAPPLRHTLAQTVPYPHRLGDPFEFAHTVHFILTNRYINGECIRMDGALRLAPKEKYKYAQL